ncbi:hypothetical protein [Pleomorphomonas koreensis]|uniref:hypothetical protein n=1 Tax=Pleomorphomonas koreensis TaxID=257440 RepID=UPI00047AEBCF|nr:hypothetical protein [Pleomorphomonas koreensis]
MESAAQAGLQMSAGAQDMKGRSTGRIQTIKGHRLMHDLDIRTQFFKALECWTERRSSFSDGE